MQSLSVTLLADLKCTVQSWLFYLHSEGFVLKQLLIDKYIFYFDDVLLLAVSMLNSTREIPEAFSKTEKNNSHVVPLLRQTYVPRRTGVDLSACLLLASNHRRRLQIVNQFFALSLFFAMKAF